jgi:hypothetical protein
MISDAELELEREMRKAEKRCLGCAQNIDCQICHYSPVRVAMRLAKRRAAVPRREAAMPELVVKIEWDNEQAIVTTAKMQNALEAYCWPKKFRVTEYVPEKEKHKQEG